MRTRPKRCSRARLTSFCSAPSPERGFAPEHQTRPRPAIVAARGLEAAARHAPGGSVEEQEAGEVSLRAAARSEAAAGAPAGERGAPCIRPRVPPPRRTGDRLQADAHGVEGGVQEGEVPGHVRSEEHTSELQSRLHLVCRLLLEKKKKQNSQQE